MRDVSYEQIINAIEQQSNFRFLFNRDLIDVSKTTSIHVANAPIDSILLQLFENTEIGYTIKDKQIVLYPITEKKVDSVSGTILDEQGEPIIGASIMLEDSPIGTISDVNGHFSIKAPANGSLQISYMGYKTQKIQIDNRNFITITMSEDTELLEEVVVIGYGSIAKRDLTGAVSSVKSTELPEVANVSIGQMLSGKIAGLQVMQTSAQPGGGMSFLIRGAASVGAGNQPLIIIDGFPVSSFSEPGSGNIYDGGSKSDLNSINPSDIESVEVLKDASATAIYGARAANGVILITTKRGKEGRITVDYQGGVSYQQISDTYNTLNASDLMRAINMYNKEKYMVDRQYYPYGNTVKTPAELDAEIIPVYTMEQINNPAANTNWFKEITRPGYTTQHNVSLSGGSTKNQYYASLNYYVQDGVIKNSGFERFSGRVNIDQKLGKYAKTGLSATVSRVNNTNSQLGGNANELSGIIRSALVFPSYLPIRDAQGEYSLSETQAYLPNPVSMLEISDKSILERFLGTVYLELYPVKNLTIRGSVGVDRNIGKRTTYLPKTTLYGAKEGGKASISTNERFDLLSNAVATYDLNFANSHKLTLMLGAEYQRLQSDGYGAGNSDFLLDSFLWYNLSAGEAQKPTVFSSGSVESMASFFGRFHYTFREKYLLTTTLRADASSRFARNKKWGYFPSIAFAWRMSEEQFMQDIQDYISNLKLRISYGTTGNANIGYNAMAIFRTGQNFQFGDKIYTGVYNSQLENPNLSWETTRELNLGADLSFFKNRINLTAEYFYKIIDGLLSYRSLPTYNEVTTIADNIGKTQSRGVELTLNTLNIKKQSFMWQSTLTFSCYRDRWLERAPTWIPKIYESETDFIRTNFFYLSDGLIQPGNVPEYMPAAVPGQVKLLDINGFKKDENGNRLVDENGKFIYSGEPDGVLDDADIVNLGCADPGYMVGFANTLAYKGFDLSVYFYGFLGRKMVDPNTQIGINHQLDQHQGGLVTLLDSWRHDNMTSTQPSYISSSYGYGDYLLQDASFMRCKNITLGYSFPQRWIGKAAQKVRIYVDLQNPFVITKYTGLDPETDAYTAAYPNIRSFSVGLDVTF